MGPYIAQDPRKDPVQPPGCAAHGALLVGCGLSCLVFLLGFKLLCGDSKENCVAYMMANPCAKSKFKAA